jgi:hypothetical protein
MVVILQHEDVPEIVHHVFFQPEGELYGDCTDEDRLFRTFLHFDEMKPTGFLKQIGAEEEFLLIGGGQAVIIAYMRRNDRVVIRLHLTELPVMAALIEPAQHRGYRFIQKNNSRNEE